MSKRDKGAIQSVKESKANDATEGITSIRDTEKLKKTETELKESEIVNKSIVNAMDCNIVVIDQLGTIIAVNDAWINFAKQNGDLSLAKTGLGSNYFDVCMKAAREGDEYSKQALTGIKSVLKKEVISFEMEYPCHSPEIKRWFNLKVTSYDSHSPKVVLGHYNITERKKAEEKLKQNQESLNNAQSIAKIGSWEYNLENYQLTCTKELYNIFELDEMPTDKLFGAFRKKIHPEDLPLVEYTIHDVINNDTEKHFEYRMICNDGCVKFLKAIRKVYKDTSGKAICISGTVQDITENKKIADELLKAKELAEQAVIAKDIFLSNMSHEIRTPMNAIIGFTDLILQTPLDKNQNEFISSVKNAGENLLCIVNDILDYSKIESGKLTIQNHPFNLLEMLKNMYNLLRVKADEKNLDFDFNLDANLPEIVSGNFMRLNQVLVNLIGNAIKFTEKGAVTVTVKKIIEQENIFRIVFKVKDTGIGVDPEKAHAIFERFTQSDNLIHKKYGGTGLGLSISKNLVELMGGDLKLKSEKGSGSEFSFELIFAKAENYSNEMKAVPYMQAAQSEKLNILVIEDNLLNQRLATRVLANFNFNTEIAENGKTGIDKLKKKSYDLILMDLQMPEVDGYQATSIIRNEMKLDIPIIAITAHSLVGEKEKCITNGMNDYIAKPFKQEELFEKICNLTFSDTKKIKLKSKIQIQPEILKSKINLNYLKELSDGNMEFENEMIELFIKKVPGEMDALEAAIINKDVAKIKTTIHSLKNSFSIVGLTECIQMLSIIEENIDKNGRALFEQLTKELKMIYPEFHAIVNC